MSNENRPQVSDIPTEVSDSPAAEICENITEASDMPTVVRDNIAEASDSPKEFSDSSPAAVCDNITDASDMPTVVSDNLAEASNMPPVVPDNMVGASDIPKEVSDIPKEASDIPKEASESSTAAVSDKETEAIDMSVVVRDNIVEVCDNLQSKDLRSRKFALITIDFVVEKSKLSEELLVTFFDGVYLHLLQCYSDRYEFMREGGIKGVTKFVLRMPPNDFHLVNILTIIEERMGQQETLEKSEEIRLELIKQLHEILGYFIKNGKVLSLQASYDKIVCVLKKAVRDDYHVVKREAFNCIVTVSQKVDTYTFQAHVEPLAKAIYPALNHKHAEVRRNAVKALAQLALHINPKEEALSQLIMEVSPLLMDSMPLVRREVGEMGVLMLLELRDRYSYFERILPLVLSCLADTTPEVVNYIQPLWVKCGRQYFDENEAELQKQEIADLPVVNYPINVQRPTIGCRALVQRTLRVLMLITRESTDWKDNVRMHSLKLLYQYVLHAEAAMTAKFFEIFPEISRACRDEEVEVNKEAYKVADIMGRLFSYADWCEHGFDGLAKNAREGYLKSFYYMFKVSCGVKEEDLLRVSRILIEPEFSQCLKIYFQDYVIKLVQVILKKCNINTMDPTDNTIDISNDNLTLSVDIADEFLKNVYITTMKVMALSYESEHSIARDIKIRGYSILQQLAEKRGTTIDGLHEELFTSALAYVVDLDAPIDERSEPLLLFYGLIAIGNFHHTYMEQLKSKILLVWKHYKNMAKIKVFSAISIAMLKWENTVTTALSVEKSAEILKDFVDIIVVPHLLWRAGAHAEAMRTFATATICTISQGAPAEAKIILPKYIGYMSNLLEDNSTATRHNAIKCLFNFGEIPVEDLRLAAYATLQRLDDPSADIRVLAIHAIPHLKPKFEKAKGEEGEYEHTIWETFIERAVNMFLLHYEGPEKRVQAAIKIALIELSKTYPKICQNCYKKTISMTSVDSELAKLGNELSINT
ncbi:dynein assembly factor 5, axonemal [Teleopsis dalmanni]|uniref:dynein assembly factor 5, axonemal n=1 Tax=Teleopsis dalmanni TaxID=139649 RepID=UPI0018CD0E26|nr:dynein assembly factor 5, axonemal [Teleopsis dalmanni]